MVTVNLALVCPTATVTLAGTVATDVLPLEMDTLAPPEGAAALRVTVPVELLPPLMLVGLRVNEESVNAGLMISEAIWELLPSVALIVAVRAVLTDVVLTVNLALVDPLATLTLLGTLALELLLLRLTTMPPEGAAELRVTVPVELLPPVTLVGFSVSDEIVTDTGGLIVNEACLIVLPSVPVIVAVVVELTNVVVTVKLVLLDPADTVTLLGKLALELSLLKLTTVPPEGAAELRVTVPVELLPPVTLVGFRLTEERVTDPPGFRVKLVDTVAPPDCA